MKHLELTKKLGQPIWAKIGDEAQRRWVQEGKETDVHLSGIKQDWGRIARRISRRDRKAVSRVSMAKRKSCGPLTYHS